MFGFFSFHMRRCLIFFISITLVGTVWQPTTVVTATSSHEVHHSEELFHTESGEWLLLAREGKLILPVQPDARALEVVIPKDGPILTVQDGWQIELKETAEDLITLHVIPEDTWDGETLELNVNALPQETEDPRILSLAWVNFEGERNEITRLDDQFTLFTTANEGQRPLYVTDNRMTLRPLNGGHIEVRTSSVTRKYAGEIVIDSSGGNIKLTNRVPLNLYLEGVVPREMPASFGVEALKAQAVTARTYAERKKFGSNPNDPNQRLLDTQTDQVYGGIYDEEPWATRVRQAVNGTDGHTLMYNGSLAATLYSSANGGMIEASQYAFTTGGGTKYPYMQARPDRYTHNGNERIPETCARITNGNCQPPAEDVYQWERTINFSTIEQRWPQIGQFQELSITERTPGNGVNWLEIRGSKDTVNVSGHQFRSTIGNTFIRSNQFNIVEVNSSEGTIKIRGGGFGHRTGMSQWGAQGLANLGATYQQILSHYYPGTNLSNKRDNDKDRTVQVELFGGTSQNSWVITASEGAKLLDSSGNPVRTIDKGQTYVLQPANVDRIKGETRYGTAAEISSNWNQANTVVIARGDDYADALAGVPLAHKLNAPMLLTRSGSLPRETRAELERLKPTQVILLGQTQAISQNIEHEIKQVLPNTTISRIGGDTRFDTARLIANQLGPSNVSTVVIVNGRDFPDAISVAPFAGQNGHPILLVTRDEIPQVTQQALNQLNPDQLYVIGGPAAVANHLFPEAKRIYGDNRFETNFEVLKEFNATEQPLYVATGLDFADAIAGAVLAARENRGILLVGRSISPQAEAFFRQQGLPPIIVFGGPQAVSENVANQLLNLQK